MEDLSSRGVEKQTLAAQENGAWSLTRAWTSLQKLHLENRIVHVFERIASSIARPRCGMVIVMSHPTKMLRLAALAGLLIFLQRATVLGQSEIVVSLSGTDQGRAFEGVGAVSAGASSRLLIDYADPYRSDILDYLFKPKFGAGFQHLKVEIGGGENSTCGSEPTHARSREELNHPKDRGYELWLMKEARARQPGILLDCLPWTYPAWIKGPFTQDATDWFVAFLDLARKQQTPLDWVSAAWNERGSNRDWIVNSLRPTLDARGYQAVKLQAPDDGRPWVEFDKYGDDAAYQAVVKAAGYHYVVGREPWVIDQPGRPATDKAKAFGKPLWDAEEWSQSGKEWDGAGAFYVARILNKMYVRDRITKTELWCPIAAFYPDLPWGGTGPMEACSRGRVITPCGQASGPSRTPPSLRSPAGNISTTPAGRFRRKAGRGPTCP